MGTQGKGEGRSWPSNLNYSFKKKIKCFFVGDRGGGGVIFWSHHQLSSLVLERQDNIIFLREGGFT